MTNSQCNERSIAARKRLQIINRDKNVCRCCGSVFPDAGLEVHHVIPVYLGGTSTDENLITLCRFCHSVAPDCEDKESAHDYTTDPSTSCFANLKKNEQVYSKFLNAFAEYEVSRVQEYSKQGLISKNQETEIKRHIVTRSQREVLNTGGDR